MWEHMVVLIIGGIELCHFCLQVVEIHNENVFGFSRFSTKHRLNLP